MPQSRDLFVARFFLSVRPYLTSSIAEKSMQYPARLAFCSFLLALAAPLQAQSTNSDVAAAPQATATTVTVAPSFTPSFAPSFARPEAAVATEQNAVAAPVAGAPMAGLSAGVHARVTSRPGTAAAAADHAHLGQSRAMMAVGVAGLIVGAIIGGTPGNIIMIGGGLVGLLGLYDYLQ
jgi:hypothetical protein